MTPERIVVVGDALLDVDVDGRVERLCPEAPVPVLDAETRRARPGGAGLAAALAAADGRSVMLVTALGRDPAGREAARLLALAGVDVADVGLDGETPTKTRLRAGGRLLVRLDRGWGARVRPPGESVLAALDDAGGILVSDYGRGMAADPEVRSRLEAAARRVPVVWDPHPRGAEPVADARLVVPNRREAAGDGADLAAVTRRARELRRRWRSDAVAVTLGAEGALLAVGEDPPLLVPAEPVIGGDPCGAGDRFASHAVGLLADGAWFPDAVERSVAAATAFVAAGGAASFCAEGPTPAPADEAGEAGEDAEALVARVRARGGTVVATGGCFDLLHAGHVATLEAARALGDCLVVCLNSDASVRRLKGADRPLVPEDDRAAVLRALACVDAVVVFEEDTPEAVLARLRPDIFAKGGDYALEALPEARLLETWGGQTVVLPYVEGRSTTRLLEEVALRAAT